MEKRGGEETRSMHLIFCFYLYSWLKFRSLSCTKQGWIFPYILSIFNNVLKVCLDTLYHKSINNKTIILYVWTNFRCITIHGIWNVERLKDLEIQFANRLGAWSQYVLILKLIYKDNKCFFPQKSNQISAIKLFI